MDLVLLTLSTIVSEETNLVETLSSKTRTMFPQNLKPVRLVHNGGPDWINLNNIKRQRLLLTMTYGLTCCHEQTMDYVTVQILGPFPQKLICPKQLKLSENLRNESTRILFSPSVPIVLPHVPKSVPPT